MPLILDGVLPADLSLPAHFTDFRQIQKELVDFGVYGPEGLSSELGPKRVLAMGAPVGSGKTIAAQAIGKLSGMKFAVLTATRSLEDQIVSDKFDTVNIRGRSNYECIDRDQDEPMRRWSCQDGEEENCRHYGSKRCVYGEKVEAARQASSIITNYQFWLNARQKNRGALEANGEKIGLLICDEGHAIGNEISRFLGIWISDADLHKWANKEIREVVRAGAGAECGKVTAEWLSALDTAMIRMQARQGEIAASYQSEAEAQRRDKEYRKLDKLVGSLERVVELGDDNNWLWRITKAGIAFDCIWPGRYAERYLWSGVEKVVIMSGTLRPKLLTMVGLRPSDYWFKEFPSVFPPQESPVYWVPTGKMGHKEGEDEKLKSVAKLDAIFEEWRNFKGIVHTNSYDRAKWTLRNSKYSNYFHLSEPGEANKAADAYRLAKAPYVLVSPSFTTGWNFSTEDQSWSVISKLPFPDLSDPVTDARSKSDEEWYNCETMQTLVQACGRQKRRPVQRTTTMITDDSIQKFRHYARQFAPRHFKVLDAPGGNIPRAPR